jgi:hypothetical protein
MNCEDNDATKYSVKDTNNNLSEDLIHRSQITDFIRVQAKKPKNDYSAIVAIYRVPLGLVDVNLQLHSIISAWKTRSKNYHLVWYEKAISEISTNSMNHEMIGESNRLNVCEILQDFLSIRIHIRNLTCTRNVWVNAPYCCCENTITQRQEHIPYTWW